MLFRSEKRRKLRSDGPTEDVPPPHGKGKAKKDSSVDSEEAPFPRAEKKAKKASSEDSYADYYAISSGDSGEPVIATNAG